MKKPQEEEFEEEEEQGEEPESNLEEEEKQIKQRLNKLSNPGKKPELKRLILKVVTKDNVPYERMQKVEGENNEVYEVITIEEALAEILSILRESA